MSASDSSMFSQLNEERLRLAAQSAARRFKNTWVEFGAVLIQVRNREAWRGWGFESFEAYCARELHIRQKTAQKLTASYSFLQRHEPEAAASEMRIPLRVVPDQPQADFFAGGENLEAEAGIEKITSDSDTESASPGSRKRFPAFETISVLAGAEERGQLRDEDYAMLREKIWGTGGGSEQEVAREIKERFSEPKRPAPMDLRLKRCASAARKLADSLMEISEIPDDLKAEAEALAQRVEEIVRREKERGEDAGSSQAAAS